MTTAALDRRHPQKNASTHTAKAQLSLIEHALCPLDAGASLQPNAVFETGYFFTDQHRNRRRATAKIGAVDGLSAHDELYLWGLLALALNQKDLRPEFLATPYFCLRRLGVISNDKKGGREFELFRAALKRLSGVRYQNDHFYDPVRGEHRAVSFGLLSYSLPLGEDSARGWRFAWDPIFFELAAATGGALSFDLGLYRSFDAATRRLYLFLKKLFWRNETTPALDLHHLTVDVVGFSPTLAPRHLKHKLCRCIQALTDHEFLAFSPGITCPQDCFQSAGRGKYRITFHRGPAFDRASQKQSESPTDSPLFEPLSTIGFEKRTIARLLAQYPTSLLEQWADITLAARERHGETFFTASPPAVIWLATPTPVGAYSTTESYGP